jgi:hypothetical protein
MTLPIYDSGLLGYNGYALSQEGVVAVGGGKFVIFCRDSGPSDETGFVVVQVGQDGIPTFGTPGYFSSSAGNTNPLAYYDKSQGKIVIFYDEYPANKYIVASVSGMTLVEDGRSTLSASNGFHYAVEYSENAEAAILCSYYNPDVIRLYSLKLTGTSLAETSAVSGDISDKAQNDNCKIAVCGDYALLALVTEDDYPEAEVRVLSNIGTAGFDYSVGYTIPRASHPYCIGLAGTDDGVFTGYWAKSSSDVPYLIAGKISSGNLTFGSDLQYAGSGWGDYFGEFIGSGIGVAGGVGVFAQRIDKNVIHMFAVENPDQSVTVIKESTSQTGLDLWSFTFCHVPIRYDASVGQALCAFSVENISGDADIYVATLAVAAPVPIFWTNHTLQRETSEEELKKVPTKKVIPGRAGQPYIPPTPPTGPKTSSYSSVNYVCERVI